MSRWQRARTAFWLRLAISIGLAARVLEGLANRVYRRARTTRGEGEGSDDCPVSTIDPR